MTIVTLPEMATFVQQSTLIAFIFAFGLIATGMILALRKPANSLAMSLVSYGIVVILAVAIVLFAIGVVVPTLLNLA